MSNLEYSDRDCTVYVGSIGQKVTEEIIFELFLQAGPLERVKIPTDKESGVQKPFGFVTFTSPVSVPYAIELLDGTSLYGQNIVVRPQTGSSTPTGLGNRSGSQNPLTPSSFMGSPNFPMPVRQNSYEQNHSNRHTMPNQFLNSPFIQGPSRQNSYEQNVSNHHGYQTTPTNQYNSHHRRSPTLRHGSSRRDSYDDDRHGRHSSKHHSHHNDNIHKARNYHDRRSSRY